MGYQQTTIVQYGVKLNLNETKKLKNFLTIDIGNDNYYEDNNLLDSFNQRN